MMVPTLPQSLGPVLLRGKGVVVGLSDRALGFGMGDVEVDG